MKYQYDDNSSLYVILTFLLLVLIPFTFYALKATPAEAIPANKSTIIQRVLRQKSPKRTLPKRRIFVALGWIVVALMLYQISSKAGTVTVWNPYDILGIHEGATVSEVKKRYRQLSKELHPDKVEAAFKDEAEKKFVDISKAYKVLTDDKARENFEKYGDPDGPRHTTFGIGLPTWIIDNQLAFLGLYMIGLCLVPIAVHKWWKSHGKYTKDGIMVDTIAMFTKQLNEQFTLRQLIDVITAAPDFKEHNDFIRADETLIPELLSQIQEVHEYDETKFKNLPYALKNKILLLAHLLRINVQDERLQREMVYLAETAYKMCRHVLQMNVQTRNSLQGVTQSIELSQHIMQAIHPFDPTPNPLLQLPYITLNNVSDLRTKKGPIKTIEQFMELDAEQQRSLLSFLDDQQFHEALQVCETFTVPSITRVSFEAEGDGNITAETAITATIEISNPTLKSVVGAAKEKREQRMQDSGPVVMMSTKKSKKKKNKKEKISLSEADQTDKQNFDEETPSDEAEPNHTPIYAPYFPSSHVPQYWIYLGDQKNRVFSLPMLLPLGSKRTVTLSFRAPPTPNLTVYLKSDCYIGFDCKKDVKVKLSGVTNGGGRRLARSGSKKDLELEQEYADLSEPEEDSLAGTMQMMRGGRRS